MATETGSSTRTAAAPLRIGYVAKVFPRLSETFVLHEAREMERQGVTVTMFSLHAGAVVPHEALGGLRAPVVQVDTLPEPDENTWRDARREMARHLQPSYEGKDLEERILPRRYVRLACQLAEAARAAGVQGFHAHFASRATHVAMLAAILLDVPYTFTAHAKDIYHAEVDQDVLRVKLARTARCVTVTDFNLRHLRTVGAGLPDLETRLVRLYNGVHLEKFQARADAIRVPTRILGVGRLVEKKGFDVLVQACGLLAERGVPFECVLVGGGEQEEALRTQVAALGLSERVHFRGSQAVEAVAAEMQQAQVMVLPCVVGSDGNVDALPTVLLEAMGCKLPVVSTTVSGIPEIVVDRETGYLVPPNDPVALADALARSLADPAHAARLGVAGRARAEQLFDIHRNVAQLREWLVAAQAAARNGAA